MCLPYTSVEDAQQHLLSSVILFDGRPVFVRDIYSTDDELQVCLRFLPRMADEIHVSLFDPRIETKELGSRLGYMNIGGRHGALYVRRIPARQYKQGLVRQNTLVGGDRRVGSTYRFDDAIRQGPFVDMMMRVYPTYEAAFQMLKDQLDLPSVAFSPEFSIVRQELGFFLLEYKGEQVAWGDPKMFKLPSQFNYLKELLNKYGVSYDA